MNIQENKYVNETTISIKKEICFYLLSRGLEYDISNLFIKEKVQEKLKPYNVLVKELKKQNYDNTYELTIGIECVVPINSNIDNIDKIDKIINKTLNLISRFVKNKKNEINAIKVRDSNEQVKRIELLFEKYELEMAIERQKNKMPKNIINDVIKKRL